MRKIRTALGAIAGLGVLMLWASASSAETAARGYRVFWPDGADHIPL